MANRKGRKDSPIFGEPHQTPGDVCDKPGKDVGGSTDHLSAHHDDSAEVARAFALRNLFRSSTTTEQWAHHFGLDKWTLGRQEQFVQCLKQVVRKDRAAGMPATDASNKNTPRAGGWA